MPTLIYDIMRVMFALTGPAAFICLVNAGIALRKEGGTVFWIGGGFSRWMLWTVIFLALEPTLVWFQFLGFPVFFPPAALRKPATWKCTYTALMLRWGITCHSAWKLDWAPRKRLLLAEPRTTGMPGGV